MDDGIEAAIRRIVREELAAGLAPISGRMEELAATRRGDGNVDQTERLARIYLTVQECAETTHLHPDTISEALRTLDLHGYQRKKWGPWKVDPACLSAWVEGRPCSHRAARSE